MTYEERRTVVTREREPEPTVPAYRSTVDEVEVETVTPSALTVAGRIITLLFGLVQILIALRIVLLALDARQANDLVRGILGLSQVFVAPFEGILRTDALSAQGATLDVAAILALIGWTILELIVLQILRIGRAGDV